jgi:protein TonB
VILSQVRIPAYWVRHLRLWAGTALFSILLNIALFGLMPSLITGIPDKPDNTGHAHMINIVRVKRPDTPTRKKKPKKQIERKIPKKVTAQKKPLQQKRVLRMKQLPFEINPKLPAVAGTIPSLPMENVTFQGPALIGAYDIGEIDGPLTPLAQAPPVYPLRAKQMGIQGWVKVKFIVNEEGGVESIEILDAQPERIFERSVIRCVSAWRFAPGTVEGVPVRTQVMTTIRFELE